MPITREITCLNRTSVGLKHITIERETSEPPQCLNRTSVGLKRGLIWQPTPFGPSPQSNQRGIETLRAQEGLQLLGPASIEPAWD